MGIKFHLESLKATAWWEHLIRFVFGGAITMIAGLIAKRYGPVLGGLFLAFPAIFPASATLLDRHERQKKEQKGVAAGRRGADAAALDARGAALGSIALGLFAVFVWQLLPDHSAWILAVGGVLWLAASIALWLLRKYRHRLAGTLWRHNASKIS